MQALVPSIRSGPVRRLAWLGGLVLAALGFAAALASWPGPIAHLPAAAPVTTIALPAAPRRVGSGEATAQYLQFEPNLGQAENAVRYLSRGPRHSVEIFDDGLALATKGAEGRAASARLRFAGAGKHGVFEAREPGAGVVNYLSGSDSAAWIRSVPRYRQLRRANLYPGVDLVYYSRDGELEFDLVVRPGADASRIRMLVDGRDAPVIAANGDLLLDGSQGALRLHRPVLYQHIDGEKKTLEGQYVLNDKRELSFALPAYDTRYPLIIDPVFKLLYSTYLTGFHDEQVGGMTLDAQSNAYIVGQTDSDDFVVSGNAFQRGKSTTGLQYNVVVTKFDASGTLIYSTYLGGSGSDIGAAIAVDAAGNAYVTGNTTSRDFPVTADAQQPRFTGSPSAYLAVLSPDGSALVHSTFYGGSGSVKAGAIALDANGAAVIAGFADPGLVTTAGAYKTTLAAGGAAFVARFSAIAAGPPRLIAASYYGVDNPQPNATFRGNGAFAMALDASGAPWITGQAYTTNLPLTAGAVQAAPGAMSPTCNPGPGPLNSFAFVARLSADLSSLTYASYLTGATEPAGGAACSEFGRAIALDASGNVYVTGGTASAAFPTTAGAVQPAFPSAPGVASYTGFVSKLKADGTALLWSTYFGGNGGNTFPAALVIDAGANAIWTTSVTGGGSNYPVTADALQRVHGGGGADAGIVQLDATSGALKYSTFLGGSSADVGLALGVDAGGNAFVAGNTFSPNFPVTANAYDKTFRPDFFGGADWFFSVLGNGSISQVRPTAVGNGGDATFTLLGAGFQDQARCQLAAGGRSIDAFEATVSEQGTRLVCRFELAGIPASSYALTITNPDATVLRSTTAVTVRDAPLGTTPADLFVDLVGRSTLRAGVASDVSVTYGNRGPNDVYSVPVWISWPAASGLAVTVDREPIPDLRRGGTLPPVDDKFISARIGDRVYLPLAISLIGAGRTASFPLHVVGMTTDTDFDLRVEMTTPRFTSRADMIALREGRATASADRLQRLGLLGARGGDQARIQSHPVTNGEIVNCLGAQLSLATSALPGGPCVQAAASAAAGAATQAAANAANGHGKPITSDAEGVVGAVANAIPCAISLLPGGALVNIVGTIVGAGQSLQAIGDACGNIFEIIATGVATGKIKGSLDPNDKTGASGDGSPQHYVQRRPFTYQIAFENVATASLPAARVVITDPLDATSLDLSTLTLGDIQFGSHVVSVPPGLTSYATTFPIDATMAVRVQGSLNRATGVLKWTLDTIDPATGLPPSDPTLGFLPPDSDGIKGQGRVSFTVSPNVASASGTTISNRASIVFDGNPAIATPTWLNTIDTTPPTSSVRSLTGVPGTTSFEVAWASLADAGSAVRRYSVFVSDNGGGWTLWQNGSKAASASYPGISGHTYAFNVVASDGAGNIEPAKSTAEATIAVSGTFLDPTAGTSGSSGGGGCTLAGDGQRDPALPLLVLFAAGWLGMALCRRQAMARSHEAA